MNYATYLWLVIRTLWCYLRALCVLIVLFIPLLIMIALMPEKRRYHDKLLFWLIHLIYHGIVWAFMIQLRIEGKEHLPRKRPSILIANHSSSLDVPLLGLLVGPHPHVWYALNRFFSTPVFGFALRRLAISVEQERPIAAARALVRGVAIARNNQVHSLLFPEGGRYNDGKIHAFFSGFAMLANKLKQPVVPIMMWNVGNMYPPSSFLIYPHTISITVGQPFEYLAHETDEQFLNRVQEWFKQQIKR